MADLSQRAREWLTASITGAPVGADVRSLTSLLESVRREAMLEGFLEAATIADKAPTGPTGFGTCGTCSDNIAWAIRQRTIAAQNPPASEKREDIGE